MRPSLPCVSDFAHTHTYNYTQDLHEDGQYSMSVYDFIDRDTHPQSYGLSMTEQESYDADVLNVMRCTDYGMSLEEVDQLKSTNENPISSITGTLQADLESMVYRTYDMSHDDYMKYGSHDQTIFDNVVSGLSEAYGVPHDGAFHPTGTNESIDIGLSDTDSQSKVTIGFQSEDVPLEQKATPESSLTRETVKISENQYSVNPSLDIDKHAGKPAIVTQQIVTDCSDTDKRSDDAQVTDNSMTIEDVNIITYEKTSLNSDVKMSAADTLKDESDKLETDLALTPSMEVTDEDKFDIASTDLDKEQSQTHIKQNNENIDINCETESMGIVQRHIDDESSVEKPDDVPSNAMSSNKPNKKEMVEPATDQETLDDVHVNKEQRHIDESADSDENKSQSNDYVLQDVIDELNADFSDDNAMNTEEQIDKNIIGSKTESGEDVSDTLTDVGNDALDKSDMTLESDNEAADSFIKVVADITDSYNKENVVEDEQHTDQKEEELDDTYHTDKEEDVVADSHKTDKKDSASDEWHIDGESNAIDDGQQTDNQQDAVDDALNTDKNVDVVDDEHNIDEEKHTVDDEHPTDKEDDALDDGHHIDKEENVVDDEPTIIEDVHTVDDEHTTSKENNTLDDERHTDKEEDAVDDGHHIDKEEDVVDDEPKIIEKVDTVDDEHTTSKENNTLDDERHTDKEEDAVDDGHHIDKEEDVVDDEPKIIEKVDTVDDEHTTSKENNTLDDERHTDKEENAVDDGHHIDKKEDVVDDEPKIIEKIDAVDDEHNTSKEKNTLDDERHTDKEEDAVDDGHHIDKEEDVVDDEPKIIEKVDAVDDEHNTAKENNTLDDERHRPTDKEEDAVDDGHHIDKEEDVVDDEPKIVEKVGAADDEHNTSKENNTLDDERHTEYEEDAVDDEPSTDEKVDNENNNDKEENTTDDEHHTDKRRTSPDDDDNTDKERDVMADDHHTFNKGDVEDAGKNALPQDTQDHETDYGRITEPLNDDDDNNKSINETDSKFGSIKSLRENDFNKKTIESELLDKSPNVGRADIVLSHAGESAISDTTGTTVDADSPTMCATSKDNTDEHVIENVTTIKKETITESSIQVNTKVDTSKVCSNYSNDKDTPSTQTVTSDEGDPMDNKSDDKSNTIPLDIKDAGTKSGIQTSEEHSNIDDNLCVEQDDQVGGITTLEESKADDTTLDLKDYAAGDTNNVTVDKDDKNEYDRKSTESSNNSETSTDDEARHVEALIEERGGPAHTYTTEGVSIVDPNVTTKSSLHVDVKASGLNTCENESDGKNTHQAHRAIDSELKLIDNKDIIAEGESDTSQTSAKDADLTYDVLKGELDNEDVSTVASGEPDNEFGCNTVSDLQKDNEMSMDPNTVSTHNIQETNQDTAEVTADGANDDAGNNYSIKTIESSSTGVLNTGDKAKDIEVLIGGEGQLLHRHVVEHVSVVNTNTTSESFLEISKIANVTDTESGVKDQYSTQINLEGQTTLDDNKDAKSDDADDICLQATKGKDTKDGILAGEQDNDAIVDIKSGSKIQLEVTSEFSHDQSEVTDQYLTVGRANRDALDKDKVIIDDGTGDIKDNRIDDGFGYTTGDITYNSTSNTTGSILDASTDATSGDAIGDITDDSTGDAAGNTTYEDTSVTASHITYDVSGKTTGSITYDDTYTTGDVITGNIADPTGNITCDTTSDSSAVIIGSTTSGSTSDDTTGVYTVDSTSYADMDFNTSGDDNQCLTSTGIVDITTEHITKKQSINLRATQLTAEAGNRKMIDDSEHEQLRIPADLAHIEDRNSLITAVISTTSESYDETITEANNNTMTAIELPTSDKRSSVSPDEQSKLDDSVSKQPLMSDKNWYKDSREHNKKDENRGAIIEGSYDDQSLGLQAKHSSTTDTGSLDAIAEDNRGMTGTLDTTTVSSLLHISSSNQEGFGQIGTAFDYSRRDTDVDNNAFVGSDNKDGKELLVETRDRTAIHTSNDDEMERRGNLYKGSSHLSDHSTDTSVSGMAQYDLFASKDKSSINTYSTDHIEIYEEQTAIGYQQVIAKREAMVSNPNVESEFQLIDNTEYGQQMSGEESEKGALKSGNVIAVAGKLYGTNTVQAAADASEDDSRTYSYVVKQNVDKTGEQGKIMIAQSISTAATIPTVTRQSEDTRKLNIDKSSVVTGVLSTKSRLSSKNEGDEGVIRKQTSEQLYAQTVSDSSTGIHKQNVRMQSTHGGQKKLSASHATITSRNKFISGADETDNSMIIDDTVTPVDDVDEKKIKPIQAKKSKQKSKVRSLHDKKTKMPVKLTPYETQKSYGLFRWIQSYYPCRWWYRVVKSAVPFQLMIMVLLGVAALLPICEEDCGNQNTFLGSFNTMLNYKDGSPPV